MSTQTDAPTEARLDITQAAAKVADMIFYPGWTFEVLDIFADWIFVGVFYTAPDSDREHAPAGYPFEIPISTGFGINVDGGSITLAGFYELFWHGVHAAWVHELREFLRDRSADYAAPFHPHRPEGRDAWDTMTAREPLELP